MNKSSIQNLSCLFIIPLLFVGSVVHADDNRPNIILCMADDQGWGDTAYNGHPVLKTPHLDAMAKSGLRFDHFYAAAPVCTPTRGSVMTGRHPNRFGAFKWGFSMRPQEITIAHHLKQIDYATAHFGKWHLGSVLKGSPVNPSAAGFDTWLSAPNFYDNDPILSLNGIAVQMHGESSMVAADAAIEFIRKQTEKQTPFLAVVWFGSPHNPHRAADEDRNQYEGRKNADWLGEITGLDRSVGKLRAALRELEIEDNTLFWYVSDNGGLKLKSTGGRGKKGSIYEGGLRVPSIIEWPARIQQPRVTEIAATTSDIFPTLMDLLDIPLDNQRPLDGASLAPTIDGDEAARSIPFGFWDFGGPGIQTPSAQWMKQLLTAQAAGQEYHDETRLRKDAAEIKKKYRPDFFPGHAAWRDGAWKLHRISPKNLANYDPANHPEFELYHLGDDPMETKNLADEQPERVKTMRAELEIWLGSVVNSLNGNDYRNRSSNFTP